MITSRKLELLYANTMYFPDIDGESRNHDQNHG